MIEFTAVTVSKVRNPSARLLLDIREHAPRPYDFQHSLRRQLANTNVVWMVYPAIGRLGNPGATLRMPVILQVGFSMLGSCNS